MHKLALAVVLALLGSAALSAQAQPAPAAQPIAINEVVSLKLQVQEKDLQIMDEQYQKLVLQIQAMQKEASTLQANYRKLELERNRAIDEVFKQAKVSKTDFDLDLADKVLTPKPPAAPAAPPAGK